MTSKDRGHVATLKLVLEAESRDWISLWAEGDNRPFDIVLMPEPDKFVRVQVKSCYKADERGRHSFVIGRGSDHKKRYTKKLVDIMAFHAFDTGDWWFINVEKTAAYKNIHIGPKGQWEPYRNNWEVIWAA